MLFPLWTTSSVVGVGVINITVVTDPSDLRVQYQYLILALIIILNINIHRRPRPPIVYLSLLIHLLVSATYRWGDYCGARHISSGSLLLVHILVQNLQSTMNTLTPKLTPKYPPPPPGNENCQRLEIWGRWSWLQSTPTPPPTPPPHPPPPENSKNSRFRFSVLQIWSRWYCGGDCTPVWVPSRLDCFELYNLTSVTVLKKPACTFQNILPE